MRKRRIRNFLGLVSRIRVCTHFEIRHIELEVIPAAKAYNMAVHSMESTRRWNARRHLSPLRSGFAKKKERESSSKLPNPLRAQIEAYEQLCRDIGHDYADVALAWVCQQDGITAPIIGPRTIEQLDANVKSLDITLDDETLKKLDEIWPGPGNQAPEAYAW